MTIQRLAAAMLRAVRLARARSVTISGPLTRSERLYLRRQFARAGYVLSISTDQHVRL